MTNDDRKYLERIRDSAITVAHHASEMLNYTDLADAEHPRLIVLKQEAQTIKSCADLVKR